MSVRKRPNAKEIKVAGEWPGGATSLTKDTAGSRIWAVSLPITKGWNCEKTAPASFEAP